MISGHLPHMFHLMSNKKPRTTDSSTLSDPSRTLATGTQIVQDWNKRMEQQAAAQTESPEQTGP